MKMATFLPKEFVKFNRNSRYLRRILKQTLATLEEIRGSGKFYAEQVKSVDFTQEEINAIKEITDSPPCIIVLGQHSSAKAALVNELFCLPVLPVANGLNSDHNWRMLCFMYGDCNEISISLPESYEMVTHFQGTERMLNTIPHTELEINDQSDLDKNEIQSSGILEVRLRHPLLKDGIKVIVPPTNIGGNMKTFIAKYISHTIPLVLYAIGEDNLMQKDLNELKELKVALPDMPVLFIQTQMLSSFELTESELHARYDPTVRGKHTKSSAYRSIGEIHKNWSKSLVIFQQLCDIGYLSPLPARNTSKNPYSRNSMKLESEYIETCDNVGKITIFIRNVLQYHIICGASLLNDGHRRCLRMFILSAFDMTRDMMITPRRLEYAREKESELFTSLMNIASFKQDEIKNLIIKSIVNMQEELLAKASNYEFQGISIAPNGTISSAWELKICTGEIEDLILGTLSKTVAQQLIASVEYLRDSFVGTLKRCLESLEKAYQDDSDFPQASNALTQILNAAYQIEMTSKTSSSFMRTLWEKMKQLVQTMPWVTPPHIDSEWKKQIATDMINSLNESRLAKSICSQFRDKLKQSHELFSASLRQLEIRHNWRLEKTEVQRLMVRKTLAPKIARYALESTSLRDLLLNGMPNMGKEIGRGQYGVVYACDSWAGHSPCALKSVVPPDDKHWNDLAMEFYYTRSIPEHDRIVTLHGSVIDPSYGGGSSPAVLLVMDRLQRDLHTAIRNGLNWMNRLQVSIDVVQGIRYLHSQGLIHRDIKLKNVLMDKKNRAKITDLGFCKPEAMMSGSIVGTPIHMAPELFTGKYDSTVDVYAFGILFWYICAGDIKLPYVYEQCLNKDQLWTAVKKGQRPERLLQFDDNCWNLMEECWSGEPAQRPLLGDVEQRLMYIRKFYQSKPSSMMENNYHTESLILSSSPYINVDFSPP